jgi:hypothetical protein
VNLNQKINEYSSKKINDLQMLPKKNPPPWKKIITGDNDELDTFFGIYIRTRTFSIY